MRAVSDAVVRETKVAISLSVSAGVLLVVLANVHLIYGDDIAADCVAHVRQGEGGFRTAHSAPRNRRVRRDQSLKNEDRWSKTHMTMIPSLVPPLPTETSGTGR
jgi:hypothetical protein